MNKSKYYANNKRCGSCEYWLGNRDIDQKHKIVYVNSDEEGKCLKDFNNSKRKAKDIHSCWHKWIPMQERIIKLISDIQQILNSD